MGPRGVADVGGEGEMLIAQGQLDQFVMEAAHAQGGMERGVEGFCGEVGGFELVVAGDGDGADVLFVKDEVGMLFCEGDFVGVWCGDASQLSFTRAVVWDVKETDAAIESVESASHLAVRVDGIRDGDVADGLVHEVQVRREVSSADADVTMERMR